MGRTGAMVSGFRPAGGTAKILEFSVTYKAKQQADTRQSWSERAGVSKSERFAALAFGALITPTLWAGHSLLMWMHVL